MAFWEARVKKGKLLVVCVATAAAVAVAYSWRLSNQTSPNLCCFGRRKDFLQVYLFSIRQFTSLSNTTRPKLVSGEIESKTKAS